MTQEEENQPQEEKRALQETKRLQGEVIRALQQQLGLQELGLLKQQVQGLQERLKKDSHTSSLSERRQTAVFSPTWAAWLAYEAFLRPTWWPKWG